MLAWSVLCLISEQTCWHTLAAMSSIRRRMVSLESETCWIFFAVRSLFQPFFCPWFDKLLSDSMRLLTLRSSICRLVAALKNRFFLYGKSNEVASFPGRIVVFWQTKASMLSSFGVAFCRDVFFEFVGS